MQKDIHNIIKFSQLEEDYIDSARIFLPPADYGNIDILDMTDFDFNRYENFKSIFTCKKVINHKFFKDYDLEPDIKYAGDETYVFEKNAIIIGGLKSARTIIFPKDKTISIYDMKNMFRGLNIAEIDISSFDTSCCNNMSGAFAECKHLTSIDLSNLDTSNCFFCK